MLSDIDFSKVSTVNKKEILFYLIQKEFYPEFIRLLDVKGFADGINLNDEVDLLVLAISFINISYFMQPKDEIYKKLLTPTQSKICDTYINELTKLLINGEEAIEVSFSMPKALKHLYSSGKKMDSNRLDYLKRIERLQNTIAYAAGEEYCVTISRLNTVISEQQQTNLTLEEKLQTSQAMSKEQSKQLKEYAKQTKEQDKQIKKLQSKLTAEKAEKQIIKEQTQKIIELQETIQQQDTNFKKTLETNTVKLTEQLKDANTQLQTKEEYIPTLEQQIIELQAQLNQITVQQSTTTAINQPNAMLNQFNISTAIMTHSYYPIVDPVVAPEPATSSTNGLFAHDPYSPRYELNYF